jgi:hypothetical protein
VSGETRFGRDSITLARALGLNRVEIANRQGSDPTSVLARMDQVAEATLTHQRKAIYGIIADPLAKFEWPTGVVANRPDTLIPLAEPIMVGLQRAASYRGDKAAKARESGMVLAELLAKLPSDHFRRIGPRLIALYTKHSAKPRRTGPSSDDYEESHWLWEAESLIRRLGDLGAPAIPILMDSRIFSGAGLEGLCRVGYPAKLQTESILVATWNNHRGLDRADRRNLLVAMRRIGIVLPTLARNGPKNEASAVHEWADITPKSDPEICKFGDG